MEEDIEYEQGTYKRTLTIEVGETETDKLVAALRAEEILCSISEFRDRLRGIVKYQEDVPEIVETLYTEFCEQFDEYLNLLK